MTTKTSFVVRGLATAGLLLGAGIAGAAEPAGQRTLVSMVSEIDAAGGLLVVDEVTYRVTESTRIHRESGQAATLAEIRVPTPGPNELLPIQSWDHIRFQAEERADGWHMLEIVILEERTD